MRGARICIAAMLLTACGVAQITVPGGPLTLTGSTVTANRTVGIIADGHDCATITITVRTASNLPVAAQSVVATVSGTGNTFGSAPLTDAHGVTRINLCSTHAETKTVVAQVRTGGQLVTVGSPLAVTFTGGAPTALVFTAQPSQSQAGSVMSPAVAVSLVDAFGNLAQQANNLVTLSLSGAVAGAPLLGTVSVRADQGIALFTDLTVVNAGTGQTLVAAAENLTTAQSAAFEVLPGPASQLAFVNTPNSVIAGARISPAVRVAVQDQQGNVVTSANTLISLSLATNPTGAALSGALQASTNGGVASFNSLVIDKAGTYTLQARNTTLGTAASAPFFIAPTVPALGYSSLSPSPAEGLADGTTPVHLTAILRDSSGTGVAGVSVQFSSSDITDGVAPTQTTTDNNGQARAAFTAIHTGSHILTARFGTNTMQSTVTFAAGAPDADHSTVSVSPTTAAADGNSSVLITLALRDINGNPVAERSINIDVSGSNNLLHMNAAATDSNGLLTASLATTRAEQKIISANVPTSQPAVAVFLPGPPDLSHCTFTANPNRAVADGDSVITLAVSIADVFFNPIGNQNVVYTVTGSSNVLNPNTGLTDATGTFAATLSSVVAETKTVTALFLGQSIPLSLDFVTGPPSPVHSSLMLSPSSQTADGNTIAITVTVKDAGGNVLPGIDVQLSASGTNNNLSASSGHTNSQGVFTTSLASTSAEVKTVQATFGTVTLQKIALFTPGPASPNTVVLTASPNHVLADGVTAVNIALLLRDDFNNILMNQHVILDAGPTVTLTPSAGVTNARGIFTATATSNQPGQAIIAATYGANNANATVSFQAITSCNGTPVLPGLPWLMAGSGPASIAAGDLNADAWPDLIVANRSDANSTLYLADHNGIFRAGAALGTGLGASVAQTADFNGDGNQDVVIAFSSEPNVGVLLGYGDGTFAPQIDYGIGQSAYAMVLADFNADTYLDIATANYSDGSISVLLSNNDGTFQSAQTTLTSANPLSLASADFNLDGHGDIVVTSPSDANVQVLFGDGNGLFSATTVVRLSAPPAYVVATDINGDGHADWLATSPSGNFLAIAVGNGDGSFQQPSTVAATSAYTLAAADFNGDSNTDVVVTSASLNAATWLFGQGDGHFRLGGILATGTVPSGIITVDLNGDARTDVAIANLGSNDITIATSDSQGQFAQPTQVSVGNQPVAMYLNDFNGDNEFDLSVVNQQDNSISVLLGHGDGTFSAAASYATGGAPTDLTSADFDGDGILDLMVSNSADNTVSLFLGHGDGSFELSQVLPAGPSPGTLAQADMNHDHSTDVLVSNDANTFTMLIGDGNGGFQTTTVSVGFPQVDVRVVDLNSDGNTDVITVINANNQIIVSLGNGDGTFAPAVAYAVNIGPTMASAGDINLDGHVDIVVVDRDSSDVAILLGNGDGTLQGTTTLMLPITPITPGALSVVDVNGDGALDMIVTLPAASALELWLNSSHGTFNSPILYGAGAAPTSVISGDINDDGRIDVLVAQPSNAVVNILLGSGCIP